jgi:leucine dehydrogenase
MTFPAFGTSDREFRYVRRETSSVFPMEGSHEITAVGVVWGMKACVRELTGHSSLAGVHVAVQGVGKVGRFLVDELVNEDARVTITDIHYDHIKEVQDRHQAVSVVRPDEILGVECDVLSPCAVGRILNDDTIPGLRCRVVAGPASDTLEEPRHAELLEKRGILYAPDFVIGGAELYQTEPELADAPLERLFEEAKRVYDVMAEIITEAKKEGSTPYRIAAARAARRVGRIGMVRNIMC